MTDLITKSQLSTELHRISSSLKNNQKLPIDPSSENALHIFQYSKISSALYEKKIMVELDIPLADREDFVLYKATPVPISTKMGSLIASPFSTYFLLNSETTKYIQLTQKQLRAGRVLGQNEILYNQTSTILLNSDGICEWKIITDIDIEKIAEACKFVSYTAHNTLITILENELYFNPGYNTTHFWEKCNNDDQYTSRVVKGRGTINLDPQCAIIHHHGAQDHKNECN